MRYSGMFFKKVDDPAKLRQEAFKLEVMRDIGERTGAFRVPIVVGYDDGQLMMERIANGTELRTLLISKNSFLASRVKELCDVYRQIGVAIAVLHQKLELPNIEPVSLPGSFLPEEECFLHGDLGLSNVLLCEGEVVLIDPASSRFQPSVFAFGPFYFDLAQLMAYTRVVLPLYAIPFYLRRNVHLFETALLAGYESRSGLAVDASKLKSAKLAVLGMYRESIHGPAPLRALWRFMVDNGIRNIERE